MATTGSPRQLIEAIRVQGRYVLSALKPKYRQPRSGVSRLLFLLSSSDVSAKYKEARKNCLIAVCSTNFPHSISFHAGYSAGANTSASMAGCWTCRNSASPRRWGLSAISGRKDLASTRHPGRAGIKNYPWSLVGIKEHHAEVCNSIYPIVVFDIAYFRLLDHQYPVSFRCGIHAIRKPAGSVGICACLTQKASFGG